MTLTLALVHETVSQWINANKIANSGTFTPSYNNIAGLLDKIAKTYTLDGNFSDPLPELDGEDLEYAKNLEEYFENLSMPYDYDSTGAGTLNRHDGTFMPNAYSYPQGKKTFAVTKPYDDLEAAFHDEKGFADIIAVLIKRLYDSYNVWKFNVKKQLLGEYATAADSVMDSGNATAWAVATAFTVGTVLYASGIGIGIVVRAIGATDFASGDTLSDAVESGQVVLLNLESNLAVPTDEATGEAFIQDVKSVMENAQFPSEGNSLNGNTVGVPEAGLKLYIKKGVMPVLEVQTLAGAFHKEDLALNVEVKIVDDFGSADEDIYAILVDPRGVKCHSAYRSVKDQLNAEGDFINYFMHVRYTLAYSRNTFLHVWKSI